MEPVITEAPTYFVYLGALNALGVRAVGVPMDERGMDTAALADLLARMERSGELERLRQLRTCPRGWYNKPLAAELTKPGTPKADS